MANENAPRSSGKRFSSVPDNRRRVSGEIEVRGRLETSVPESLLLEYKRASSSTDKRENLRFVVECITLLSVLTVGVFSFIQTREAIKSSNAAQVSARAAVDSTYMACLSAQSTQATLIETRRSADDFRASTVAAIGQATAGIMAERSNISFNPRFPKNEELFERKLSIPFSMTNSGKTEAKNVKLYASAVLVAAADSLDFHNTAIKPVIIEFITFPSGLEIPEKPTDPNMKAVTQSVPVSDSKGTVLSVDAPPARRFLDGNQDFAAIYGELRYEDPFGKHRAIFCKEVSIMKHGTTRGPSDSNEIKCFQHNHLEDQYPSIPVLSAGHLNDGAPTNPVICIKPTLQPNATP